MHALHEPLDDDDREVEPLDADDREVAQSIAQASGRTDDDPPSSFASYEAAKRLLLRAGSDDPPPGARGEGGDDHPDGQRALEVISPTSVDDDLMVAGAGGGDTPTTAPTVMTLLAPTVVPIPALRSAVPHLVPTAATAPRPTLLLTTRAAGARPREPPARVPRGDSHSNRPDVPPAATIALATWAHRGSTAPRSSTEPSSSGGAAPPAARLPAACFARERELGRRLLDATLSDDLAAAISAFEAGGMFQQTFPAQEGTVRSRARAPRGTRFDRLLAVAVAPPAPPPLAAARAAGDLLDVSAIEGDVFAPRPPRRRGLKYARAEAEEDEDSTGLTLFWADIEAMEAENPTSWNTTGGR
jgi:hypothetical protein